MYVPKYINLDSFFVHRIFSRLGETKHIPAVLKGSDQNISRDIWCEMFWWRGKGRQNILNDFIGESIIMRHHKIVL